RAVRLLRPAHPRPAWLQCLLRHRAKPSRRRLRDVRGLPRLRRSPCLWPQGGGMNLLPVELRAQLPALYAQEGVDDPIIHIKFFTPDSNWTWYVTEGSDEGEEFLFFGYVIGFAGEWGYFPLSELEAARGPLGLPIERDLHFNPAPWSQVRK